jgi:hypothetical protein
MLTDAADADVVRTRVVIGRARDTAEGYLLAHPLLTCSLHAGIRVVTAGTATRNLDSTHPRLADISRTLVGRRTIGLRVCARPRSGIITVGRRGNAGIFGVDTLLGPGSGVLHNRRAVLAVITDALLITARNLTLARHADLSGAAIRGGLAGVAAE